MAQPLKNKGRQTYSRVLKELSIANERRRDGNRLPLSERQRLASAIYQDRLKGQKGRITAARIQEQVKLGLRRFDDAQRKLKAKKTKKKAQVKQKESPRIHPTFNELQQFFSIINSELSGEERIPYRLRLKLLKEEVYPVVKASKDGLTVAEIYRLITDSLQKLPPKESPRIRPTFNELQQFFSIINSELPGEERIPYRLRVKLLKEEVYPVVKASKDGLTVAEIYRLITDSLQKLPPAETCNPHYLNRSIYGTCDWWMIPYHIKDTLPPCINVKVSAGEFGETPIFNTANYVSRYQRDVFQIRANINNSNYGNSGPGFEGVIKLIDGKLDNGQGDNYYIDFVLLINDIPVADATPSSYKLPSTRKVRARKQKIDAAILERIGKLKLEKKKKRVQERKTEKQKKVLSERAKKAQAKQTVENKMALVKDLNKTLKLMEKQFKHGFMTKKMYKELVENIRKIIEQTVNG